MTKIAKVWLARHYPHWAADTAMRYLPVARFLGRHVRGGERVLEVGGGDYGLSPYWSGAFVLTDLKLFRRPEGLPKVEASTLGLPFPVPLKKCCREGLSQVLGADQHRRSFAAPVMELQGELDQ